MADTSRIVFLWLATNEAHTHTLYRVIGNFPMGTFRFSTRKFPKIRIIWTQLVEPSHTPIGRSVWVQARTKKTNKKVYIFFSNVIAQTASYRTATDCDVYNSGQSLVTVINNPYVQLGVWLPIFFVIHPIVYYVIFIHECWILSTDTLIQWFLLQNVAQEYE